MQQLRATLSKPIKLIPNSPRLAIFTSQEHWEQCKRKARTDCKVHHNRQLSQLPILSMQPHAIQPRTPHIRRHARDEIRNRHTKILIRTLHQTQRRKRALKHTHVGYIGVSHTIG